MSEHPELSESEKGVMLSIHVQPGAGTTSIVGRHGDALKIRVAAPPTDGRANDAVIDLLATEFGLAKADIELLSGESHRQKKLRLGDLDLETAARHVERVLDQPQTPHRR